MLKIRVGGVPEYFNLPFHIALEQDLFRKANIDLEWRNYPSGTGAMLQDLTNKEIDLAITLTEGTVANIYKGSEHVILGKFVESPLIWGIHTAFASNISVADMENKKYAISRKSSGSHLMAKVHAKSISLPEIDENNFIIVNNLNGAIEALSKKEADLFFWEKYTTHPYVENKVFKRIGECPTPWNAFVYTSTKENINIYSSAFDSILDIITSVCSKLKTQSDLKNIIAKKYDLDLELVNQFLPKLKWSEANSLSSFENESIIQTLKQAQII